MSTTKDTTDDSSTDSNDNDNIKWSVTADGMTLRKNGYNYELVYHDGAVVVPFSDVRTPDSSVGPDDAYQLRNSKSRGVGTFDPDDEAVPAEIATAFTILAEEI